LAELRALLLAALPIGAVQIGLVSMGTVDTLMVGRLSAEALGGVALGNWWKIAWLTLGQGSLMVLDGVISEAIGARDNEAIGSNLVRGMVLALIYSILLAPTFLGCAVSLGLLGQPSSLLPLAGQYATVQIMSILPTLGFVVMRSAFQAVGSLRPVLLSVILANLLNPFLNYALIWGLPRFGIPAMGAIGSAWATVLCSWVLFLALPLLGRRVISQYIPDRSGARDCIKLRPMLRLAALGLPVGLHQFTESVAFAVMMLLVGAFGVTAVASHQVAISMASIPWNVALGISAAAAVRVGRAVGRKDPDAVRRACRISVSTGAGMMVGWSALMIFWPTTLARVWSSDPGVVAMAASLLPIAGAFGISDGVQTVASGVLRGLLDTRGLVTAALLGYWAVGTPASLLLSHTLGFGAKGVWWGMVLGLSCTAGLVLARVRRNMKNANKLCAQVELVQ